jgi:hypothetical protein
LEKNPLSKSITGVGGDGDLFLLFENLKQKTNQLQPGIGQRSQAEKPCAIGKELIVL